MLFSRFENSHSQHTLRGDRRAQFYTILLVSYWCLCVCVCNFSEIPLWVSNCHFERAKIIIRNVSIVRIMVVNFVDEIRQLICMAKQKPNPKSNWNCSIRMAITRTALKRTEHLKFSQRIDAVKWKIRTNRKKNSWKRFWATCNQKFIQ